MKVILKQDVQNLGFKDDVVAVKNGYGRNYLIPQGMAALATPSELKQLEETLRQRAHREKAIVEEAQKTAEALKALETKITAKVGAGIKLFGSVTTMDLAAKLAESSFTIDKKFIKIIGGSVKSLGKYTAEIRLHRDVVINFEFEVVAQA
ncbi:MAG: 50S ribosomal protein L9 [Flavobacteriales bacterium]|nr:50S ribosomal protein L9 [Flavobacteriales bacterium]